MIAAAADPVDPFRQHGGRIDAARAAFPDAPADWIDLSTGISPWGWPATLDPATLATLPSPAELAALEAAAAAAFGVPDPAHVVAVPGTDLALRLLGSLFGGSDVAVVRPGYSGHVSCWPAAPATIVADALPAAADGHDIVLLANPNNPDGRVIDRAALRRTAALLATRGGWLIVDEAFADAADTSLAAAPPPNAILLRSFGKFYGLPGIRLGFVIAPPAIVAQIRRRIGDWPLSGPAIAIGTAAYRDTGWASAQRLRLATAAERLDLLLVTARLPVHGGTALFRLTGGGDALFRHLAAHAILTRPFAEDMGRVRIGLPATEAHWHRLAAALHDWS